MVHCPWCGEEIPLDQYISHVDQKHSNILPAGERQTPDYTVSASLRQAPSDKEYDVEYMEKGTYKPVKKQLTRKELIEFYQEKPYEQIISVHKITR